MKIKIIFLLAVFFVCFGFTAFSQNSRLRFGKLGVEDGLSQASIYAMIQDSHGYLWIGTNDGLNRYDGYSIKVFKNDEFDSTSIAGNLVRDVYEDKDGNVWVATSDGLSKYNRETENFTTYRNNPDDPNSIAMNYIWSITQDKTGKIWLGLNGVGADAFDPKTQKFEHFIYESTNFKSIAGGNVRAIFEDSYGELWLGTESGLCIYNRKENNFQRLNADLSKDTISDGISSNRIFCIFEDYKKRLWFGTQSGLNIYDRKEKLFKRFFSSDVAGSISSNIVTDIKEDKTGTIWVATSYGLNKFVESSQTFITYLTSEEDNSLASNHCTVLCVDNAGMLWIGSELDGISKYDKKFQVFQHFRRIKNTENTLPSNNITSFVEANDSILWIGTNGGGLVKYNKKTDTYKIFVNDPKNSKTLSANQVTYLFIDRYDNIWVGTKKGLNLIDPVTETFTTYYAVPGDSTSLASSNINYIYETRDGDIWIATAGGISKFVISENNFKTYKNKLEGNSLSFNNAQCIVEDKEGNLWIGTRGKGVDKFDPRIEKFKNYNVDPSNPNSLSHVIVLCLYVDKTGNLWIGTKNGGLCLYDKQLDGFINFRERDGLASNMINAIVGDDLNNLWISTNRGISRFTISSKTFKNFILKDGLQGNEFNQNSRYLAHDGKIYFGGLNGYNVFNPKEVKENPYEPLVVITNFKLHNKTVIPGKDAVLQKHISETSQLILSYDDNVISFEFAALHFIYPERNKYAYMLEGFDKDWVYTDASQRFVTYTNLNSGTYTFKVRAANSDGIWSTESKSIKIKITPPFWTTWWFIIIAIAAIITALINIYKFRVRRIQRRQAELELMVENRTSELKKINEEVMYQKERMEIYNQQLVVQQEELVEKSRKINEQNDEMLVINDQLKIQKEELELQKSKIDSSIRYAKRIQEAMLPTQEILEACFTEIFLIYKPKDVVSGDFYWHSRVDNKDVIAAVDCTGHGVPGAFMSMIGDTLLDQIINMRGILSPDDILEHLHQGLTNLKSEKSTNQDGMDMAICVIDRDKQIIEFAGAKNPMLIVDKAVSEEPILIKGDKMPIGGNLRHERVYTKHTITISPTASYYIFSDGLQDQFGGPEGKKFGIRRIMSLLQDNSTATMSEQKEILELAFESWKNNINKQIDDILFIGFKV